MTTISEQQNYSVESNPLSNLLARSFVLNWEVALYVVIFALAIFTRFYNLGDRVMSHDESLHTRFSFNLYNEGSFQHTPLMHGPILFHAVAFFYYLFADNDFTARIYTAVLGVGMVMFPLLFRQWLGRTGAILASFMILISPLLMYYNRYIREDTPSIFYTLIMVYCALMYLDGPAARRGKAYWLYIFAGAMLASLGSKESAFIYIAIFGSILTLYWVIRMAQEYLNIAGKTWFYTVVIGVLLAGVVALAMYVILDIVSLDRIYANTATALEVTSFVTWTLVAITLTLAMILGTLMWAFRDLSVQFIPSDGLFALFMLALFVVGGLLELWAAAFFLGLALIMGYLYSRLRPARGPWNFLMVMLFIAILTCAGLIILEEVSHVAATPEATTAPVPGQETAAVQGNYRPYLLYLEYIVGAAVIGGVIWMKGRGIFDELKRFPEFDVLIIMGTLVLPWLTAFIMKAMGANPTNLADVARVSAAALNWQGGVSDYGLQIFFASLTLIPMAAIAITVGLAWDFKRWTIAAVIFHVLFAFFFTTMFTNINGLGTGMIGSLGYWLEQQGVRRGSQPQYYYLLIILPFYEFLPIVGSVLAMVTGMALYWRHIRTRTDAEALLMPADQYGAEKPKHRQSLMDADEMPTLAQVLASDSQSEESADVQDQTYRGEQEQTYSGEQEQTYSGQETYSQQYSEEMIRAARETLQRDKLEKVPFLLLVSWWAIFNLIAYTLAGEKMPWLGTHMTLPLILLTAWFFGTVIDRIEIPKFLKSGWMYLLALPVLFVALANLVAPFFTGSEPFAGLTQIQLQQTYTWIALLLIGGVAAGFIVWLARQTGWSHLRTMIWVSLFAFLSVLTFRSAWISSFIEYDYALEPLVYAHSAPAVKTVLDQIEELSFRTTDGMGMVFAYDDLVSWPYSWYFRNFTNARFMGSNINTQVLSGAVVVVVGEENRAVVEPLLDDRFYRFEYIRMWWPLQDYFGLTAERVVNVFDMSAENLQAPNIRLGIFDIWWSRDYSTYGRAVGSDLATSHWPVRHRMYVYIRRDVMEQVWTLGAGEAVVVDGQQDESTNLCISNWQPIPANLVFGTQGIAPSQLSRPIGMSFSPDGNLYVAEENNNRLSIFDSEGNFITTFGQAGNRDVVGPFFTRPLDVAFSPDGFMYVVDTWNYRIQVFDPDGNYVTSWGQVGEYGPNAVTEPTDGFWGPRDAVVDSEGRIYVADTGNKRVRVYDALGQFLFDIGTPGSQPGQLEEPVGLALDEEAREIYVAEWWNQRISVFSMDDGTFHRTFDIRAWYEEFGNRPYIALDAERNLVYVTDPDGGRVLVFDTQGNCVGSFGQLNRESPDATSFVAIGGIALDTEGNIFVADAGSGRILRFPPFVNPLAPAVEVTPEVTAETTVEITLEATTEETAETTSEVTDEATAEMTPAEEAETTPESVAEDTPEATPEATAEATAAG